MNNITAASGECSSGCESGWTVYLEKSLLSPNCSFGYHEDDQEEYGFISGKINMGKQGLVVEEDMSMVSDASSGPPHYIDDSGFNFNNNYGCLYPSKGVDETNVVDGSAAALSVRSQGRNKQNNDNVNKKNMMLDDTASSKSVPHHLKKHEFVTRNKSKSLMESHRMVDLSQDFSSAHIKDGFSSMDLFGHYDGDHQTQFLGGKWMGLN